MPAICLLYFKRKPEEKPLRILFLLATAALLFPVFGWALNGFSYMANRWVWAYSLLVAYIVTTQWQKLRHITVGQAVACVGALALYSLLAIPLMTTDARNIGVSVLLALRPGAQVQEKAPGNRFGAGAGAHLLYRQRRLFLQQSRQT